MDNDFFNIRKATLNDLDFLVKLEEDCFPENRRSLKKSIKNSIQSSAQFVFIADAKDKHEPAGSVIAFIYKHSIRIYSIAVNKKFRQMGLGDLMLQKVKDYAIECGNESITLEVDANNVKLINWYRKHQFDIAQHLPNYYGENEFAYRMVLKLNNENNAAKQFIVVSDAVSAEELAINELNNFYSPEEYITEMAFSRLDRCHVLNLCKSYRTHSMGYYVSLLAAARNHKVTPTVMAVKDISNLTIAQSLFDEIPESFLKKIEPSPEGILFELVVVLGHSINPKYSPLAKKLYELFEVPFFSITIDTKAALKVKKITPLSPQSILNDYPDTLKKALLEHLTKKRHKRTRLKTYKYDLAILIDKNETTPPSCPDALNLFAKAAEKVGFFAEFITKADSRRICEFDALFIRETTAVQNHTYTMARNAYTEGLVVIDDPWSILLCSNKIFLHEKLANFGVCQPRSWMITKKTLNPAFISKLPFPLVLKLPESSFSQGVYCVNDKKEMQAKIKEMFTSSSMVIAQEFMKSDYDWRIGIMDNTPLFACKYYMANDHWQIYNWNAEVQSGFSGRAETIPINQVPPSILKTAIKATSLIGNGLYGVDLKEVKGKAYVIEINDNPNIDEGVEDSLLGEELYIRIMTSIYNRIEAERQQVRYLI
ncbi:MAG: GNAT family N-acetyltransferase [Deltaproteobacteria bacterium]|nr:GNAT family N-acetyltransferase [Deltaproteobacteria bacterium]